MAITDKFNGSKTALLVNTTTVTDVTTLETTSTTNTDVTEIPGTWQTIAKIIDLGTIQNESNVIDVPEFGQDYAGKLVGQLNAGTLDMSVAWDPGDTEHGVLQAAVTAKSRYTYAIRWDDGGGTNFEYVGFNAYVASFGVETTIDDAVKASVSLAIDGQLYFFNT
jgi:hypothetical protein